MDGKIIKGIAGFYYVLAENNQLYTCKAKGIFRKDKEKPLVGDDVEISVVDEATLTGNVDRILKRRNELIRPAVANIDQALIVFALHAPEPNFDLLDRFLIMMEQQGLPIIICFNKQDLSDDSLEQTIRDMYKNSGYQLLFLSARREDDTRDMGVLKEILRGKTTALAGPSGVGKSTLTNHLSHEDNMMETGALSEKLNRGKHTTRHTQLIKLEKDTYLMDTPGFTSLQIFDMDKDDLRHYYPEFEDYEGQCKFLGCSHVHEPGCVVRQGIGTIISPDRYNNYCSYYKELAARRKY